MRIAHAATFVTLVLTACAMALQEPHQPAKPTGEHEWLQQLVGEWTSIATADAAGEGMKFESTEIARSIGNLWVVVEANATIEGSPMNTMMTLGYDPAADAFVGSWVDSMNTRLWTYRGKLDETRKTLTLEAEGPAFDDPKRMAWYRDAITFESKDHKVLTSSIQGADGKWTQFMRADYRRNSDS